MTWIALQTDDWTINRTHSNLEAWCKLVALQQKGKVETTLSVLGKQWFWSKTKVSRFLSFLQEKGLVSVIRSRDGIQITIVNFEEYPTLSHQKKVKKEKRILISSISGKLPLQTLSVEENIAVWMWRQIAAIVPDNLVLNGAGIAEWSEDIRKLLEVDKRDKVAVRETFSWAIRDDFWGNTIRSASGFRRHYDKIRDKMNRAKTEKEQVQPIATKGAWLNKEIEGGKLM